MGQGDEYPDVEEAMREYLISQSDIILGNGSAELPVFIQDFPPSQEGVDAGKYANAVMVREIGGFAWMDLPINQPSMQIWSRAEKPEEAKVVISRIYSLLEKFGPGELNSSVYAYNISMNTGRQRLDDPDNAELAQYFMIYDMIVREC